MPSGVSTTFKIWCNVVWCLGNPDLLRIFVLKTVYVTKDTGTPRNYHKHFITTINKCANKPFSHWLNQWEKERKENKIIPCRTITHVLMQRPTQTSHKKRRSKNINLWNQPHVELPVGGRGPGCDPVCLLTGRAHHAGRRSVTNINSI